MKIKACNYLFPNQPVVDNNAFEMFFFHCSPCSKCTSTYLCSWLCPSPIPPKSKQTPLSKSHSIVVHQTWYINMHIYSPITWRWIPFTGTWKGKYTCSCGKHGYCRPCPRWRSSGSPGTPGACWKEKEEQSKHVPILLIFGITCHGDRLLGSAWSWHCTSKFCNK